MAFDVFFLFYMVQRARPGARLDFVSVERKIWTSFEETAEKSEIIFRIEEE